MSLSHCCGGILATSSLQNCFNSVTLKGFRAWNNCLRSCHSISIGFKSRLWLGHSKTLIDFFLEPFRGGLTGMFGIIVLLHNPGALELEVTNWRPDILLQDFQNVWFHQLWASCPGPEAAKQPPDHHTTTTIFGHRLNVGMIFFSWKPVLVLCQM